MKLGVVTYNIAKDWDIAAIIEKLSAAGLEGVELRTTHSHGVELSLTPEQRRQVRRQFEDSPITLVGLGSTYEYHSPDPQVLRRNIEGTKEYARLAADVGASGIKVRPNGVNDDTGVPREKTYEQIAIAWDECAGVAADLGVEVRMEVHGWVTQEPDVFHQIASRSRHPNAKVCWNSNPPDVGPDGSIEGTFRRLADRIGLVHMRDLYEKDYPWRELVRLLRGMSYQGFCLLEIPESTEPNRVLGYAKALWDAYNDLAARA